MNRATATIDELASYLGVSRRYAYKLTKTEGFPRARQLGPRTKRHILSEIDAWLAAQSAASLGGEPPQLQRGRVFRSGQAVAGSA